MDKNEQYIDSQEHWEDSINADYDHIELENKQEDNRAEENPEILTEIEYKTEVAAYHYLFDFFYNEHGLTLLHSEMDDIIKAVDSFKNKFNSGLDKPTLNY